MTSLDQIRADIVKREQEWADKERFASGQLAMVEAELEAHDRAVTAMANGAAKPERAARRDLAALVKEALTDAPQTEKQIADAIGVPLGRVQTALARLMRDDAALQNADKRWTRFPR